MVFSANLSRKTQCETTASVLANTIKMDVIVKNVSCSKSTNPIVSHCIKSDTFSHRACNNKERGGLWPSDVISRCSSVQSFTGSVPGTAACPGVMVGSSSKHDGSLQDFSLLLLHWWVG